MKKSPDTGDLIYGVDVVKGMTEIKDMLPDVHDMENRLDILIAAEPVVERALTILMKVINVTGMGKRDDT